MINNINMKKIIDFCILFALYVYSNYIYHDWDIYTKVGKILLYPAWFVRSLFIWLLCPIFLPEYWFKQTSMYKYIKKFKNSPEYKAQMAKSMNSFNMM